MVTFEFKRVNLQFFLITVMVLMSFLLAACSEAVPTRLSAEILVRVTPTPLATHSLSTSAINEATSPSIPATTSVIRLPTTTQTIAAVIPPTITFTINATTPPSIATLTLPTPTMSPTVSTSNPLKGKLVYTNGSKNITLINPDGSGKKIIGQGANPLFSPDGQQVAFSVEVKTTKNVYYGGETIVAVNLDGSGRQEYCTSKENYGLSLQRWSPRGRFIALIVRNTGVDGSVGEVSMCNMADYKINGSIKMSQGIIKGIYDWSPDGENALWQTQDNGSSNYSIYYGDPDKFGVGAVKLTNSQYLSPAGMTGDPSKIYNTARFSPDGKTIAIGGEKIFFVSVPGHKSPLEGRVVDGITYASEIAWSPDGQALAVRSYGTSSPSNLTKLQIVLITLGRLPEKITTIDENVWDFDWSRQ